MSKILVRRTFNHRFQQLMVDEQGAVSTTGATYTKLTLKDVTVIDRDLTAQFQECKAQLEGEPTADVVDWSVKNATPAWFNAEGRVVALNGEGKINFVKSAEYLRLVEASIQVVNPTFVEPAPLAA